MAWKTVSFKIGNFGTRIWLFEVPRDSFSFNGRLKIAIIPNRLDEIFCGRAILLQILPNYLGKVVPSLLIDIRASTD